jgi:hypothetical protein
MNYKELAIGIFWFVLAHTAVWFQLNGQFIWKSFRKYEILVAGAGAIISFFYIWGTKHGVEGFNGQFWPIRFMGFSIGILIYGILVSYFFNQGINLKTFVSLLLCVTLILIQILWK